MKPAPSNKAFDGEEEEMRTDTRFEACCVELECEVSRNPSF